MLLIGNFTYAQTSSLIIRAKSGGKFWLVADDMRKNLDPETQVSVIGLDGYQHHLKVTFEKASLGSLEADVYVNPATELHLLLRPSGVQPAGNTEIVLLDNGKVALTVEEIVNLNVVPTNPVTTNPVTTQPVQPVKSDVIVVQQNPVQETPPVTVAPDPVETSTPEPIIYVEGYTGPVGCEMPMSEVEYDKALNSIKSKSYDNTRMILAKQITHANCLTVKEIKGFASLLSYDRNKLEYVKFAYPHTYDRGNFYQVNDIFDFPSYVEELDEFLQTQK